MSITNEVLIKMNEEYIKFLKDKLTTNTLTDEQYELMLQIYKLMSEELKTEEEKAQERAERIRQIHKLWKEHEVADEEDEEEGDAVVHAYIDRLVDEMLPN